MNSLVKSLIFPLLESEQKGIALIPGGFKPPTIGHFVLVDEVAQNPNFDKVIVLIGHKVRDGVTKEESLAIWDIYKKYLPSNVEIKISDNSSPIADISSLIKNNPDTYFYPVVGIRGEMDLGDIKRFDSLEGKYPNFKTIVIKTEEGEDRISGTKTRAALISGEKDKFQSYLPTELSQEEKDGVWSILTKTPLNEIKYAEPSKFDYPKLLKSLTEFMLDKGMNIKPLPKVKFIEDDVENARDFFGKTAYYDRNQRVIVLYTMDRHPKDIMRSFAHEMIHHIQNLEDRLNGISTQNTNEEGDLPEIEREAYEKGNMTFRNWTDTLTEGVLKEGRYDTISNKISGDIFNYWKKDFEEYIQALNINTKGFEEDDLALPNPQEKSTPSPTIKEPLNENKPITIDMGKVNKALLKGMGHEKETDENILATIDAHPPGKVPHTTFLDFYAKFDKYFGEKDDDRVLDETGLEHILVNVLKLSPEDIKIVMDDYQKGNKDLEDVNWFEKYDTTHQKDEEWNPAGGKKFDDSKDTKSSVDNYLSKNKKLHEKKGFDKKLGKDPFGLNQFAREIMQEEEGSDTFDYLKHLKLLTNHMLNKGINLRPLPTVKFINDDGENAKDFFGKTAYYNPNSNQIVLYTLNRHPKDVMRSFAHEMIHHHQNCEDRLGNITTQNTNEEGDLPEIEKEANTKGTMTFREWTDTLTEGILKENTEEEDDGTLSYESIFKPDINILVAFKNYKNYFQLKPLFDEHGYGFYYPKDKIIILNGERFVNSNLDFKDLKFVEAHEITHLLLGHTGPYSEEDEMDADLGAYILLKNKKLSTDRLVNEFENRHGVPFTEELLERVKNRL
jgi:phosphopantetheine adenylyltransferase/Zn-dependent peptidase ImmA (M78 family)